MLKSANVERCAERAAREQNIPHDSLCRRGTHLGRSLRVVVWRTTCNPPRRT